MRLLPPGAHTGFLGNLCVPDDLYWVAREPVALAGMSYPGRADWTLLHEHGIGHIVCLSHAQPSYDPAPCTITAIRLQDLVSGGDPNEPERERALVEEAAADVVAHLEEGIGVAVHCMGGRGRTGTVVGVALGDTRPRRRRGGRAPRPAREGAWPARLAREPVAVGGRSFGQVTTPAPLSASPPDRQLRDQGACMRSTAHEPESDPK